MNTTAPRYRLAVDTAWADDSLVDRVWAAVLATPGISRAERYTATYTLDFDATPTVAAAALGAAESVLSSIPEDGPDASVTLYEIAQSLT